MISQLTKLLKLLIGFPLYIIANNIVINLVSVIVFQYYHFYIYGVNCVPGFSTKSIVITTVFILFKIAVLIGYYYKKYDFLFYYLIFDVIISLVLLFDYLFGTLWIAYFYANRPIINLSKYLFGNYTLVILQSVITLLIILKRKGFLKKEIKLKA